MSFLRIGGVLLHYRLAGPAAGPVIAFSNSLGTDLRIWDDVVARLGSRYRLLTYDKRGHGLSDSPPGEYSLEDHVDDLAGLFDRLGIAKAVICGVSIGGLIARGFASRHPERTLALVLCDTALKFGDATMWTTRIEAVRRGGMAAIADAVMERWFSPEFIRDRPDDLAGWRNLFLQNDVEGYASTCATLRSAEAGEVKAPSLVVAGAEDRSTPVETVRDLARAIPGARFEIVPGAGHIPSIEQPDKLAGLIERFLEETGHG